MNIKDIIEKIKKIFPSKAKRLEASKDKKFREECEKEGRIDDYENYLTHKNIAVNDIQRFQMYIENNTGDVARWKYELKNAKRAIEFIRPNNPKDIEEREYWRANFYNEFLKVMPENLDLRFHGTPIYNAKAILESGGIFSSADLNDGYIASTDLSGEISASSRNSLNRTIDGWFADFRAYYTEGLPCGCIFALNPRTEKDKELKKYDAMESVDFKKHPEQLYGIFTSKENISNVQNWLESAGFSKNLVYSFNGFLKKLENEKNKNFNGIKITTDYTKINVPQEKKQIIIKEEDESER